MSAIGTKRTYRVALHMSAFGGKADIAVGRVSSETHPDALLAFPIVAVVGVLTVKVWQQE